MRRLVACASTILLISAAVFGLTPDRALTQYLHRIWQTQQGLPQATIYSITQTKDGYLWLGTQTGLVRFDGVRFTNAGLVHVAELDTVWVRELLEDRNLNFWIGTNAAGLFRLRGAESVHYSHRDGLPSDGIRCLVSTREGDLWVCTTGGISKLTGGKLSVFTRAQGLSNNNLRAGCQSKDGSVWLGGEGPELEVWKGNGFRHYWLHSLAPYAFVRTLLCSEDGDVWIGTSDGLIRLRNGEEKRFSTANGLPDNRIFYLMQSREGSIWIGTDDGFARLRNGEFECFRSRDGLSQSAVYAMFEDHEGDFWVGTKNGLNQFLDGRSIPYTVSDGLPSNDAGPVLQDASGHVWVGTLGAGLAHFDGRRFVTLTTKDGLASDTVYTLAQDPSGVLWAGTAKGLNRLRDGKVEGSYLLKKGVHGLLVDRKGMLWIGTSSGIAVFRSGTIAKPKGLASFSDPIRALGEDREGRIFVATENGPLKIYEDGDLREFKHDGAQVRDVDAFYEDKDGLLWMGTLGSGLRLLRNGRIFVYYLRDGLFDNEIYGITSDADDRLWMACSKGLFMVPRKDLLKLASGEIHKIESHPYSPMDGLRTIECKAGVQPSVFRMRGGSLWFSTTRGLIALDVGRMLHPLAPPQVVIEDVIVNGQRVPSEDIEKLPPGERKNLEFHYTGLSFVVPGRITFRYMLEGFDKNWIDAGTRREAFYTNLPPGKYRFRVTACNVDGTCNETGSFVAFTLAPRFYQRKWFIPLCILLAAVGAWLAYQLRIQRLRAKFDLVLGERTRIARELHDTLIQGFSGITMAMQALSARIHRPEEKDFLLDIIQDAGECLREARRSVAGLRGPRGTDTGLSLAIAAAARQITETKDIRLRLKLEPDPKALPADVEYNLLRIAQEAVSNSVKHSGARSIEVALRYTTELVHLSVKDDGGGFAAENGGGAPPGHYGLLGMQERASHIGARFELDSELGRGTTVSVELPAQARES